MTPTRRQLKKGEFLFQEGDSSRAMYVLQSGMIRIFKNKGKDGAIEIDTIRSGQILGELAFLDGNPRSASGQALTDCTLHEISAENFTQTMSKMPEWLLLLLKTVVGRLRAASTRIRQIETASTAIDYSLDKKASKNYVYLSTQETLKTCSAVLLVAARNGEPGKALESPDSNASGVRVRANLIQRYANQIFGVPVAKVTSVLDALAQARVLSMDDASGTGITVNDIDTLEAFIAFQNEQNLCEPDKQKTLSLKGFLIMSLIAKFIDDKVDAQGNETYAVNLAEIVRAEETRSGRPPFRYEEVSELSGYGYCSVAAIQSADIVLVTIRPDEFRRLFKTYRLVKGFTAQNEKNSKAAQRAA